MKQSITSCIAVLGVLLTHCPVAAKEPRFPDVVSALHAADSETLFLKRNDLFKELESYPVQNCDQAKQLYTWLEDYPSRTFPKGGIQQATIIAKSVATALSHTTAPECHKLIAGWLAREVRFLPPEVIGATIRQFQASEPQIIKGALQYERINALIHAAGDGKNEIALPTLRKILKKGLYDYSADYAVGRIGKEEDLEWFVTQLEKGDRSLRMRLQEFGPLAIRRIMREVEDPNVPREKSERLRHWIGGVRGRENMPLLVPLLQNRDPFVVKMAAKAIENNATREDEALLFSMLEHQDNEVRQSAVNALARDDIWKFRYIEPILRVLKSDRGARFAATQAVGRLVICESIPILQEVIPTAQYNDSWPSSHALDAINRLWTPFPSKPTGRKWNEYAQSLMDSWSSSDSPDKDRYWAAQNWAYDGIREKAIPLYQDVLIRGTDDVSRHKSLRDLWRMQDEEAKRIIQTASELPDVGPSAKYALDHWTEGCRGENPAEGKRK